MRVLMFGASGYYSQHLLEELHRRGHEIAYTTLRSAPPADGFRCFTPCDATVASQVRSVFERFGEPVHAVIDAVTYGVGPACEMNPAEGHRVAVESLRNICAAAPAHAVVLLMSTDLVYGDLEPPRPMRTEADDPHPSAVCVYGETKLAAETVLREARPRNHLITRSPYIWGPRPNNMANQMNGSYVQALINQFTSVIAASANAGAAAPPRSMQFTDEYRMPVYVFDAVRSMSSLLEIACAHGDSAPASFPRTFNLGGFDRVTRFDFASRVARLAGFDVDAVICPLPQTEGPSGAGIARRPADISMDSSLIQSTSGVLFHTLDETLPLVVASEMRQRELDRMQRQQQQQQWEKPS